MNAPSITPAQILAALGAILGLLVSLTVIDDELAQALAVAASTLVPIAFTVADAIIRNGRAHALASGNVFAIGGSMYTHASPYTTVAGASTAAQGTTAQGPTGHAH